MHTLFIPTYTLLKKIIKKNFLDLFEDFTFEHVVNKSEGEVFLSYRVINFNSANIYYNVFVTHKWF